MEEFRCWAITDNQSRQTGWGVACNSAKRTEQLCGPKTNVKNGFANH